MAIENSIVILVCLLIVVLVAFSRRKTISGNQISLLRFLLPSWRFFDDVGWLPKLYYRIGTGNDVTEWRPLLQEKTRPLSSFIVNPEGNLALAFNSLLEQLIAELNNFQGDQQKFETSVSYRLTENMVRSFIAPELNDRDCFQFKLTICSAAPVVESDVLISLEHQAHNL